MQYSILDEIGKQNVYPFRAGLLLMLCFMLCVMLCYVMLCYVMLCYVMLCYVMRCYVMLFIEWELGGHVWCEMNGVGAVDRK